MMSYEESMNTLGFKYLGPCPCRQERGYMWEHPTDMKIQLWVYPGKKKVKKKVEGVSREIYNYTETSFEQLVKTIAGL